MLSVRSGPRQEPLSGVRQFARALRQALDDVALERAGADLRFFYDADVAVAAIGGMKGLLERPVDPGNPRAVVHALLFAGHLPMVHFTRHHLVEFQRWTVHRRMQGDMAAVVHRANMEELRAAYGLNDINEELRELSDPAAIQRWFDEVVRRDGLELFVKLSLTLGGDWRERLARMHRYKRVDIGLTPEYGPPNSRFRDLARQVIDAHRPQRDAQNQADVLALDELRAAVQSGGLQARFYTDTHAVRTAVRTLSAYLATPLAAGGYADILRDEEYMLIRASFDELSFDSTPRVGRSDGPDLAELEHLADELESVFRSSPDDEDPDHLEEITIGQGQTRLPDLLRRFYNLELAQTCFLSMKPTAELTEWLGELGTLLQNRSLKRRTSEQISIQIREISKQLRSEVDSLSHWHHDYAAIRAAVVSRREKAEKWSGRRNRPPPGPPRVADDIGIGRWGIERGLADPQALEAIIAAIWQYDDPQLANYCAELAMRLGQGEMGRADVENLSIICWFLNLDGQLRRLLRVHTVPREAPTWIGLETLRNVVAVREIDRESSNSFSSKQARWNQVMDEMVAAAESVGDQHRAWGLMGVAHVRYWVWTYATRSAVERGEEESSADWLNAVATGSIDAANEASEMLEKDSLAYRFAVNHIAYVGVESGQRKELALDCNERLGAIPEHQMHYRFSDTIACFHLRLAQRLRKRFGPKLTQAEAESVMEVARRAQAVLGSVTRFYGDREFEEHEKELDALLSRMEYAILGD